jgi:excinuclease UvrABC nuclease subunit
MCDELDDIPEDPGIYVFGRRYGVNFEPHYVGQAKQIQKRVLQQLRTNVPLSTSLWHAKPAPARSWCSRSARSEASN